MTLKPAPKLIREARIRHPDLKIIGFKAETGVTEDQLVKLARESMVSSNLSLVVANDVISGGMGTQDNNVLIIDDSVSHVAGTKRKIAEEIMNKVESMLRQE